MNSLNEKFIQREVENARKLRAIEWKAAEEKHATIMNILDNRVSDAILTSCDGLTFQESLRNAIKHNPDGPWVLSVRCMDNPYVAYNFTGFVSKEHRVHFMKQLITKYHGDTLKKMFPTSDGWSFQGLDCQVILVRIPTPEFELLDVSTYCPFGLDAISS